MSAAVVGPWEVGLGGLVLILALLALIGWFGRHDPTKRVRFGFFFERDRYADEIEEFLKDAPPEVRRWFARFFAEYPPPWRSPRGEQDDPD